MKRLPLGISAAVLILAGAAFAAQDQGPAAQPETRAEAQTRAAALFDKLDLNHDGKLDETDRAAQMSQRINKIFDHIDTNHDGMISRQEFVAHHMMGQDHMMGPDHGRPDHGGPDHPGMHGGPDDHMAGGHMGHWGYDHRELGGLIWLIVQRADPGHSGTVTREAFIRAALSLFDQADTNHDGVLTPDEHRAYAQVLREQARAKWQQHGGPDGDAPPPPPVH